MNFDKNVYFINEIANVICKIDNNSSIYIYKIYN